MSRELKFRGWDTRKNVMYSAEEMGRDQLTLSVDGRGFINVHGSSTKLSTFPKHIIPLQYTGLKDKNGVEIWEGDITERGTGYRQEIKLIRIRQVYSAPPTNRTFWAYDIIEGKDEVIGNIHTTPKLLEARNV